MFLSSRSSSNSVSKAPNSSIFWATLWAQRKLLRLRLRRRYNKNRAIIELRSIADHSAGTTAWSQLSWSFDRPVRTGDIRVPNCAVACPCSSRPVENRNVWKRPKNTVANNKIGTNNYNTNYTTLRKQHYTTIYKNYTYAETHVS